MKLNLTPERIALLKKALDPIAGAKGPDRKAAQGILFSIGAAERKAS